MLAVAYIGEQCSMWCLCWAKFSCCFSYVFRLSCTRLGQWAIGYV